MDDPDDWHTWVAENPFPSLQELIAVYGTYSQITPEAWAQFDRARADWDAKRRARLHGTFSRRNKAR